MKTLLAIVSTLLFYTSCSTTYFYSTLNTNDPYTNKNTQSLFIQEGDSLDITYSFYGENAIVTIGIVNKMSKAVYIDWRKSGVIIDSIVSPFINQPPLIQEDKDVNFSQYMNDPRGLSYIRPYSSFEKQVMELSNFNFNKVPSEYFLKQYTEADSKGHNRLIPSIQYNEKNSPLLLKTYLTVYEESASVYDPLIFESDFYISEIIRGGKRTGLQSFKDKQGDIFFVRYEKSKFFKNIGESTRKAAGITTVTLGNIALWAIEGAVRKKD